MVISCNDQNNRKFEQKCNVSVVGFSYTKLSIKNHKTNEQTLMLINYSNWKRIETKF